MRLRLREFHAPAGEGDALVARMRNTATTLVQKGVVDIVVVCQHANSREHALWLDRTTSESPSAAVAALLPGEAVNYERGPLVLDFVDALYRFPLLSCRVWTLETRHPAMCRAVFGLSRRMQYDRRLVGMSVYRAADEPSHAIAFLALEREHVPAEVFEDADWPGSEPGHGVAWYPLAGVWTFGRLTRCPGRVPTTRYPRAAFWAQLGVSVMHDTDAEVETPLGASAPRRISR